MEFRHLAAIVVSLFTGFATNAQPVTGPAISFTYDAAGNRILREYKTSIQLNRIDSSALSSADLSKTELHAYPNPTDGIVNIDNQSWAPDDEASIKIFDITGKFLQIRMVSQAKEQMNLTSYAPGFYQMHYYRKGQLIAQWKIVKNN